MKKFFARLRKSQKGFTLIELLVVIAILGVIAAVAVPNILEFLGSGETEAAQAERHSVVVAVTAAMYTASPNAVCAEVELDSDTDCAVTGDGTDTTVGAYLVDGLSGLQYAWNIAADGTVTPGTGNPLA